MPRHFKTAKQTETACGQKWASQVTPIRAEVNCGICLKRTAEVADLKKDLDRALEIIERRLAEHVATPQEVTEILKYVREDGDFEVWTGRRRF